MPRHLPSPIVVGRPCVGQLSFVDALPQRTNRRTFNPCCQSGSDDRQLNYLKLIPFPLAQTPTSQFGLHLRSFFGSVCRVFPFLCLCTACSNSTPRIAGRTFRKSFVIIVLPLRKTALSAPKSSGEFASSTTACDSFSILCFGWLVRALWCLPLVVQFLWQSG